MKKLWFSYGARVFCIGSIMISEDNLSSHRMNHGIQPRILIPRVTSCFICWLYLVGVSIKPWLVGLHCRQIPVTANAHQVLLCYDLGCKRCKPFAFCVFHFVFAQFCNVIASFWVSYGFLTLPVSLTKYVHIHMHRCMENTTRHDFPCCHFVDPNCIVSVQPVTSCWTHESDRRKVTATCSGSYPPLSFLLGRMLWDTWISKVSIQPFIVTDGIHHISIKTFTCYSCVWCK